MSILNIIVLALLIVFSVIGLIVGLVKGYDGAKSWGTEYILSSFLTIAVGAALNKSGVSPKIAGIAVLALALVFIILAAGLTKLLRFLISRTLEKRDDDLCEPGAVGAVNRILGGISVAVNGFALAAMLGAVVYAVIDMSNIEGAKIAAGAVINGGFWICVKPYIFDFIVLGVINIAVRHGYSSGISSFIMGLIVIGVLVGCGFAAYALVFNAGMFGGAAQSLSAQLGGFVTDPGLALTLSRWLIVAIVFLAFFIITIIVYFIISVLLTFPREGSAFYVVDGILGALVNLVIFAGVMLFAGALIQPVYDLEFMRPFTEYFSGGAVAKYFYTQNLLTEFGLPALLPLREWLAP